MFKQLKKYVEKMYNYAEKNAKTYRDIENWRAQAYGALMFCIDNDLVKYDEVTDYWNAMWSKFHDLNSRG